MTRSIANQANQGGAGELSLALLIGAIWLTLLAGLTIVLLPVIPILIAGSRAVALLRSRAEQPGRPRRLLGSGAIESGPRPIDAPMRVSAASAQGR